MQEIEKYNNKIKEYQTDIKRIFKTRLTFSELSKLGLRKHEVTKEQSENVHKPIEVLKDRIRQIEVLISELYNPNPQGIENEYFNK